MTQPPPPLTACKKCKDNITDDPSGLCASCNPKRFQPKKFLKGVEVAELPVVKKSAPPVEMSDDCGKNHLNISDNSIIKGMATITTTLVNTDMKIVKTELYDPDVMDALLTDTKTFSKRDLGNLSRYKRGRLHGNAVEVVYHYGVGCAENQLGRLYPHGGQGLQAFPFDMRNPLLEKHYWDCDMENAHYNYLARLADDWGLKTDAIKYYIANRDKCLSSLSSNRGIAKTAFLKVAYGGQIKLYNDHYNDEGIAPDGDITHLKAVEKEMVAIVDMCWVKYSQYQKIVKKKPNEKFSLFALILQTEERKCLLAMDDYLKTQGRQMDIFIHDGGEVRKLPNETKFPEHLLRGMEKAVFDATGHSVKIVVKPFQHNFTMPDKKRELIDDEYAGRTFVKLCGDNIARDGEDIYYFNEQTGMWQNTETAFRTAVIQHKEKLLFKQGEDTINYGGKECNVMAMRKWILPSLEDTQFITRNADSSKYKLLFTDGIFDFNTGFKEGFDPKIVFNKRIDRPYPKERDENLIKKVNDTLFVNAFGDETIVGEYEKKALVIGLVGDYRRKKFYFGIGDADCGKGVLVSAMTGAFGGYIGEWNPNNLKYNPRNGQDEAKQLAWIKGLIGCRLGFSNELRMDKTPMDGNLLKALSSGGDEMKYRTNHKDEEKVINRCSMWLLANDLSDITPKDSGTTERIRVVRYRLHFVDKPAEECGAGERPKDPEIKDWFKDANYQNALFHLMWDTYKAMPEKEKKWNGRLSEPPAVMEDTKEWAGDVNGDFKAMLEEQYEITNCETDKVETKLIIDFIVDTKKQRYSPQKIGRELSKLIKLPDGVARDEVVAGKKYRLGVKDRNG